MKYWYRIDCYAGHNGAGRYESETRFVFARDTVDALKRHNRMPGIKRSMTPNISELSIDQARDLEQMIIQTPSVSMRDAKKKWACEATLKRT